MPVRSLAALSVLALLATGCGSGDLVDVNRFCPLARMPHRTLADINALRARGASLVGTSIHYKRSARNERIVSDTLNLLQDARVAQLQLTKPTLLPKGDSGLDRAAATLRADCAAPGK